MNSAEFQLRGISDPRLAVHATGPYPAWLWSTDGTEVWWANPAGARLLGAANGASLGKKIFGPADSNRRQVAQLAHRLPPTGAVRLERLRGFGAPLSGLITCGCVRLDFADGSHGILIVAAEPVGRVMPLLERLQRLVEGVDAPMAAFACDGTLVGASEAAGSLLDFHHLSEAGLEQLRDDALKAGHAEVALEIGKVVLQRVGSGADVGLIALITPAARQAAEVGHAAPAEAAATARLPESRRHPLRFTWQMDADGRLSLGPDEFTRLIGAHAAAGFGRPWREIAERFGLDPEDRVLKAIATRNTWSGITVNWPVDAGSLAIELSGLPICDDARNFIGYRGFGVCRDLDGLARLAAWRRDELHNHATTANATSADAIATDAVASMAAQSASTCLETPQHTDLETAVEPPNEVPANVVLFRPAGEQKAPVLTSVENSAFDELARQLSARLESDSGAPAAPTITAPEAVTEPAAAPEASEKIAEPPNWLTRAEPPARGQAGRDKMLLDLLPVGVLIYRLDRLLYANPAFLDQLGYPNLHALEQAGGIDALYVEPGVSNASSTSDTGTPVTISAPPASSTAHTTASAFDARLYTISWDDDSALALIFSGAAVASAALTSAAVAAAISHPAAASEPSAAGQANAESFDVILDAAAEGLVMFDAEGRIHSCNRSAAALFGHDRAEPVGRHLAELFAPESQAAVRDYLAGITGVDVASPLDHGREVMGRAGGGGLIPLSITIGRTKARDPNFFAVLHDLSPAKKNEAELREARRFADRAANAKADLLARISHEVRTPLNAILGFSEVMISERFGALGNQRYIEYMKDIRASGERVITIIDDLADLSGVETGKIDLTFADHNLNELVESCVAAMQPLANRERIIIRTSLAPMLPQVTADTRVLRQIALNLIGNSIHLANPGGQVIVSTALSDFGEVVLRVRDSGHGLNDNEVAAAMAPFRTQGPSDRAQEGSAVSLSLTKALVEANRAQFHIRTGHHSGTLVEVVFAQAMARAMAPR